MAGKSIVNAAVYIYDGEAIRAGHRPGTLRIGEFDVYFMQGDMKHDILPMMRKMRDLLTQQIEAIEAEPAQELIPIQQPAIEEIAF